MKLANALSPVIDLIYPPRCPLCGEGLVAQSGLCSGCWGQLVIPGEPCCQLCQRPFADGMADGAICAPCLASPPRHDGISAATLYNDPSRQLVLAFKHGRKIALSPVMARLIATRLPKADGPRLFVPVPLHRWRLWHRGYNQAGLLARDLARQCGGHALIDGLMRTKRTPSLGGLGRKARARALSGAIVANPARIESIKDAEIILVDDVLTSGTTTNACVSALKRAGANSVRIACFARVMDEAL